MNATISYELDVDLISPRFEVICDYPNSPYKLGEILTTNLNEFKNFPSIFKELKWWERPINELPEFVGYSRWIKYDGDMSEFNGVFEDEDIIKVKQHNFEHNQFLSEDDSFVYYNAWYPLKKVSK